MKNILTKTRNKIIEFFYLNIFKKIFFKIDPEIIHDKAILTGRILGSNFLSRKATFWFFGFSNSMLEQNIAGINFKNPVGLAAGFDKNAQMIKIMPSVGFGFMEVGSFTGQACVGNPKPRLWRLAKSQGLLVNYGLNNLGVEFLSQRLANQKNIIPLGINIGKTNSSETVDLEKGITDYLKGIKAFIDIGDYLVINISCPNAYGGESFSNPELLNQLLEEVDKLNIQKPVFLKMVPDLDWDRVDAIINLVNQYNLAGFICSNLIKDRNNPKIVPEEMKMVPEGIGSISGKPVEELANQQIRYIYKKTQGQKVIIGCGGIFSAEDAYKKIRLGANLVQLITGMIFQGPQLISQINLGLYQLLKRDGFKNVSQAVGIDVGV